MAIINLQEFKVENMKIGFMGGTFDPIHLGHLAAAETIREKANLDKIIFITAGRPPHKMGRDITKKEDRFMMTKLATLSNPFFEVSAIEMVGKGYSYTVDTAKKLSGLYTNDSLYYILGADAVMEILSWRNPEKLLSTCKFIAATRPGIDNTKLDKEIEKIFSLYKNEIIKIDVPAYDISSTEIRQNVRDGKSIKYMVPEIVENYIKRKKLYMG